MKTKQPLLILLIILFQATSAFGKETIPPSCFNNSHDITTLQVWGPYSKRYAGISHIPNIQAGMRFDFSVMPGYYRNRQLIPHVLFESSYYPWDINAAMNRITYRYEMEWKDRVFTDVTYYILDEHRTLVGMRCVNNTTANQNLVLNLMAYLDYESEQPQFKISEDTALQWYKATDYVSNETVRKSPQYNLVYDGWKRNEMKTSQSLGGFVLGKGFGKDKGDKVVYEVNILPGKEKGRIGFRYHTPKGKTATFQVKGMVESNLELKGTGEYTIASLPYSCPKPGKYTLELYSEGTHSTDLDGFFVGTEEEMDQLKIVPRGLSFTPEIKRGKAKQDFILKYPGCDNYYGLAWNFPESEIREVLDDNLESFFRKKTHDHVSSRLIGNRAWHYSNAFLRPIVLAPHSEQTIYALICTGTSEQVSEGIRAFHATPDHFISQAEGDSTQSEEKTLTEGKKYEFGHQLLQSALLSNIVYPVHTQGEYIRHFTPGKNWNSLYTWDSGFIALGLIDIDITKAFECIRAYTTPVGSESAFIHHGTPLPIQMYAYYDLWNNTQSREALQFLYPRLKQFFDFMVGNSPYSTTRMKGSGLLRTWDYFYNSGGWDDYPPQHALRDKASTTPVVSSAYYIRAAKILRLAAKELGIKKDIKEYDAIIQQLSDALQAHSWDEESGYFGYVLHDADGEAKGIYRHKDGSNFNKGLDGVSPLIANISSKEQTNRMINHIFSPQEMWTPVGISTVDQSASYFRPDGYWNGAVWFPHQWMVWKALLDLGEGEKAYHVANTALNTWEKECRESYYTFEHFIISSQRGAGWHQFSGLSSPILNWFATYYRIGKVSTGFEVWISDDHFNEDYTEYQAKLSFDDSTMPHERCVIVCMNPEKTYQVLFNGKEVKSRSYYPGLLEITLPETNKAGRLLITSI
ncbi:MGH1-like glycoside hydrolase domain-containing protein [Bacteroides sp. 224]|uniref:MGH1-like glycoside hydrolase domain-containing protein n=1 Tax=Bacteroides sp. 224 TaxID=2302936 RepID=UPI0013D6C284|nr:trehalase family glycosidase [Bacteroides sp. 224]NDV64131.1 glycoside hydrolase [Bacteroides sp. 224]